VYTLVLFEFHKQGKQGSEVVGGVGGIEVEDGGEGEAQEEVVCCAAGKVAGCEGGKAREVWAGEEERIKPVDAAFVPRDCQYALCLKDRAAYAFRR